MTHDPDETPFDMPRMCCKNCGREDEHQYCEPWAEAIRNWWLRMRGKA